MGNRCKHNNIFTCHRNVNEYILQVVGASWQYNYHFYYNQSLAFLRFSLLFKINRYISKIRQLSKY